MTASTSSGIDVAPNENLIEALAVTSSLPMAISTCDGCGIPAEQAEPVEHSIPWASSNIKSESPSQPLNEK